MDIWRHTQQTLLPLFPEGGHTPKKGSPHKAIEKAVMNGLDVLNILKQNDLNVLLTDHEWLGKAPLQADEPLLRR